MHNQIQIQAPDCRIRLHVWGTIVLHYEPDGEVEMTVT